MRDYLARQVPVLIFWLAIMTFLLIVAVTKQQQNQWIRDAFKMYDFKAGEYVDGPPQRTEK